MNSTDGGRQKDFSEGQAPNAQSSIRISFEPGEKVTVSRPLQYAKHELPIASIDDGIEIDESRKQRQSAERSSEDTLELDPKPIDVIDLQPSQEKHPIASIPSGITIPDGWPKHRRILLPDKCTRK
jgi:hypothetical protein